MIFAVSFLGVNCEIDINECASNPCFQGSKCIDGIDKFTCECKLGYTGRVCDQPINECLSNPCMNGGTCFDKLGFYDCTCAPGFTGECYLVYFHLLVVFARLVANSHISS